MHVLDRDTEFLRNEIAKAGGIQHPRHAHDPMFGPTAHLFGDIDHGIKGFDTTIK